MSMSLLHNLCSNGDLDKVKEYLNDENLNEIVEIFYENEIDDDQWTFVQKKDKTPLICAIENNHLEIVKYLCQNGANLFLLE